MRWRGLRDLIRWLKTVFFWIIMACWWLGFFDLIGGNVKWYTVIDALGAVIFSWLVIKKGPFTVGYSRIGPLDPFRGLWYNRRMANLVLWQRQPTVMTRALKKRLRLSRRDKLAIWVPVWGFFACVAGLILSIVWQASSSDWVPFSTLMMILSVIVGIGHIIWWFEMDGGHTLNIEARRTQVILGHLVKQRAHRDMEKSRVREMNRLYTRYSVLVQRDGSDMALRIVKHEHRGRFFKDYLWFPWESATTQIQVDNRGSYQAAHVYGGKVSNPTLETVKEALTVFEEKAMELENKAYNEAVKAHMLDALAGAVQPPTMSRRHQRSVEGFDPRLTAVIGDYERMRREDP